MKRMNNDFPCKCGHTRKDHIWYGEPEPLGCRKSTGFGITGRRYFDTCNQYVPDNLKYLEQLDEQK